MGKDNSDLVEESSLHLVNGAFSRRYFEIAQQLHKRPVKLEVPEGTGFTSIVSEQSPELIALTQNETSTGVSMPMHFVESFRNQFPNGIIVVDAVSSLPYPSFNFSRIDSLFFSVQKGFGLPAGLGVWLVNERCIEKADRLLSKGVPIGSYHSIPSLVSFAQKKQTPETPNVLALYLLSKVIADLLRRGITTIRRETEYKAALLYNWMNSSPLVRPFVASNHDRSATVIVADCGSNTQRIADALRLKGLHPGEGYGPAKKTQLRFANFPAHSKEQYELLVDTLDSI
jgi:phosphoserine aminotransferase